MKRKDPELALARNLLRSLEFVIRDPVLEDDRTVVALKKIRARLKRAIKRREPCHTRRTRSGR